MRINLKKIWWNKKTDEIWSKYKSAENLMKNGEILSKFDEFWYKPKSEENLMNLEVIHKSIKIWWNLMNYEVKINVKKI